MRVSGGSPPFASVVSLIVTMGTHTQRAEGKGGKGQRGLMEGLGSIVVTYLNIY